MEKIIAGVEREMEANWKWFKSFDQQVYLLLIQMVSVDPALKQEYFERYRFQLEIQRLFQKRRGSSMKPRFI